MIYAIHRTLRARGVLAEPSATPEAPIARREVHPGFLCYGDSRELEAFTFSNTEFFEPIVIPFARWSLGVGEWFALILALGVAYLGRFLLGLSLPTILLFSIAIFVTVALLRFITASYYRISPGRLEILEAPFLFGALRLKRRLSLDLLAITCRFDRKELTIARKLQASSGVSPADYLETVDLSRVARPHEFARALLRGTICSHRAPELPENSLIG